VGARERAVISGKKECVVSESIVNHRLGNGLVLIVEPVREGSSATFVLRDYG